MLVLDAPAATILLTGDLVHGGGPTDAASQLLTGLGGVVLEQPTDVMPLVPWATLAMAFQVSSLAIFSLVAARAANVFS